MRRSEIPAPRAPALCALPLGMSALVTILVLASPLRRAGAMERERAEEPAPHVVPAPPKEATPPVNAPDPTELYEARTLKLPAGGRGEGDAAAGGGEERVFRYRLLLPIDYTPDAAKDGRRWPLILFLHGAGERGDENRAQLKYFPTDMVSAESRDRYRTFILAPQCPPGRTWTARNLNELLESLEARETRTEEAEKKEEEHENQKQDEKETATAKGTDRGTQKGTAKEPARKPELPEETAAVLAMLDRTMEELPVDPDRVYLTGLSMGGFGSWYIAALEPRRWAAVVPICGGASVRIAPGIKDIPIWVFHGGKDTVVPPRLSREMVEALRAAGGKPRYTEFEEAGHDSWTPGYRHPEFLPWLFAQRRDGGKEVRR